MQLQKIDIDWDIHRLIEAERKGFEEPPYLALRRLLGLPSVDPAARPAGAPASTAAPVPLGEGKSWREDGVEVPHGAHARMRYLRGSQVYEGQFLDGQLVVDGHRFETLSAAAIALAVTRKGEKTSLNGWNYWEVKMPGATQWTSLKSLRDQVRARRH